MVKNSLKGESGRIGTRRKGEKRRTNLGGKLPEHSSEHSRSLSFPARHR